MTEHYTGLEFRWGILSTGGIATAFARDLSYLNNHVVAAVGSRNKQSAEDWAVEFPGCRAYGSYEELVNDPNIDAIYVSTPHTFHAANTILALSAGLGGSLYLGVAIDSAGQGSVRGLALITEAKVGHVNCQRLDFGLGDRLKRGLGRGAGEEEGRAAHHHLVRRADVGDDACCGFDCVVVVI